MPQDDACADVSNFGLGERMNYAVIDGNDCGAASPALGRDILAQGSCQPARRIDRKSRPNWAVFVTPLHGRTNPQLAEAMLEVILFPVNPLLQSYIKVMSYN